MTKTKLPTVSVSIPEIKLNLADLAYMRGLLPGNQRCHCPSNKTRDKLVFLGLVVEAEIQPTKEDVDTYKEQSKKWKSLAQDSLKSEDWVSLSEVAYNLKNERFKPKSRKDHVLTDAGVKLMNTGSVVTKTTTQGCA